MPDPSLNHKSRRHPEPPLIFLKVINDGPSCRPLSQINASGVRISEMTFRCRYSSTTARIRVFAFKAFPQTMWPWMPILMSPSSALPANGRIW